MKPQTTRLISLLALLPPLLAAAETLTGRAGRHPSSEVTPIVRSREPAIIVATVDSPESEAYRWGTVKLVSLFLLLLCWSGYAGAFFCFGLGNVGGSGNHLYSSPFPPGPPLLPNPGFPISVPGTALSPYDFPGTPEHNDREMNFHPQAGHVQSAPVDYQGWRFRPMDQERSARP